MQKAIHENNNTQKEKTTVEREAVNTMIDVIRTACYFPKHLEKERKRNNGYVLTQN